MGMDSMSLVGIVGQLFFACIVLFMLVNFARAKQKSNQQEEIIKLTARLANLRLILKAKVKKKTNYYRNVFPQPLHTGDMIDTSLNKITELKFESGPDFQTYVNICRGVNQYLKMSLEKYEKEQLVLEKKIADGTADEEKSENTPRPKPRRNVDIYSNQIEVDGPYSFMTPDMKTEFSIIKIIDEIVHLVLKIKEKIVVFNRDNPKKPLPNIDQLEFPALMDIKRIYQENPDLKAAKDTVAENLPTNLAS